MNTPTSMEILEPGNDDKLLKLLEFKCKNCDCKFRCGNDVYRQSRGGKNDDYIVVKCPHCNNDVFKGE